MIVRCPGCRRRVSNKQSRCPYCRADLDGSGGGLSAEQAARRQRRRLGYRLELHSYAAMLLTVAGAGWMFVSSDGFDRAPGFWPTATMVAGAIWYVAVRVYWIFTRLRR